MDFGLAALSQFFDRFLVESVEELVEVVLPIGEMRADHFGIVPLID